MKQNGEFQNQPLISENICDDGKYLWFTEYDYNALFKIDKRNMTVIYVGCFPEEKFMQERLFASNVLYDEKIYFAPYMANDIAVYDIKKGIFKKHEIPLESKELYTVYGNTKFFCTLAAEHEIYFIPDHYPGILCYNIKEDKFTCFSDWINVIEKIRVNNWGYFSGSVRVNNKFIFSCACADAVVIFDILTKQAKVMPMKNHKFNYGCEYSGICYVDGYFYLITGNGTIIKRKLENEYEEIKKIKLIVSDKNVVSFYPIHYRNGYLYLFPYGKNKCFKMDIMTEKVFEEKIFEQGLYQENKFAILTCVNDEKYFYLFAGNKRKFIIYDDLTKKKYEWKLYLSSSDKAIIKEIKEKYFIQQLNKEKMIIENNQYTISYMLNILWTNNEIKKKDERIFKKGNEIYRRLKV